MSQAAEWGTGQVFLSFLWFALFVIWIWLLIVVFADIFRSRDLSGWAKALWTIFVVFLPYLGVLVYLIARGSKMSQRTEADAEARDAELRRYAQTASTDGHSSADEISQLADLHAKGVLSDTEFEAAKAKALGSQA